jgi:hypothetical protein
MRGAQFRAAVAGVCLVASRYAGAAAAAPDGASPLAHFGLADQPVPLPGAGRIIFVFICIAALAVGLAALVRRWSPGLLARFKLQLPVGLEVKVLGRQRLEAGVNLHVVSVAGERLAIVTSRAGVAMHTLPGASE